MRALITVLLFFGVSLSGASGRASAQAIQIAHRYDDERVVFLVKNVWDPSIEPGRDSVLAESVALPAPVASRSGMQLWDWPSSEFRSRHEETVSPAPIGERRLLFAGKGRLFHVTIEKHLVAQMNCEAGIVAMGRVDPADIPRFRRVDDMHYLVLPEISGPRTNPDDSPAAPAQLEERSATPAGSDPALEAALEDLLARELPRVRRAAEQDVVARRRGLLQAWRTYDERLANGEATLAYDRKTFRISPDGVPRLYVRAKWTLDPKTVFLLGAWFRSGHDPAVELTLESLDVGAAHTLRTPEFQRMDFDLDSVDDVFNIFDHDNDGWGELLKERRGYESYGFDLFEYSEDGLGSSLASYSYGC